MIELGGEISQKDGELYCAISAGDLTSVSAECKAELLQIVADRGYINADLLKHLSRPEASSMTAEERRKLPPSERRTFHQGPHDSEVVRQIQLKMDGIEHNGKSQKWKKAQFNAELRALIAGYRQQLKQGNIALNSNHREWAMRIQPGGGKVI
ncbi:MAG: hypothetical protein V4496_06770 [Pseudomonadota bacterium]